jgi:hypothetical protein
MLPDAPTPAAPSPSSAASPPSPVSVPISAEARVLARTILEVLAGLRSITDAALVLGVSTARYQQWESRAIAGLITACEPRPPGPVPGAGLPGEVERLRGERDRLVAEVNRYQTLLRISQDAFGGPPAPPAPVVPPVPRRTRDLPGAQVALPRSSTKGGKPRKKRTPTVRAMRLAKRVGEGGTSPVAAPPPAATPAPPGGG